MCTSLPTGMPLELGEHGKRYIFNFNVDKVASIFEFAEGTTEARRAP